MKYFLLNANKIFFVSITLWSFINKIYIFIWKKIDINKTIENVGNWVYRVEIMYLNFRINFMNVTTLSLYLSIQALHKLFPWRKPTLRQNINYIGALYIEWNLFLRLS